MREADVALRMGAPRQPDLIQRQILPYALMFMAAEATRGSLDIRSSPKTWMITAGLFMARLNRFR